MPYLASRFLVNTSPSRSGHLKELDALRGLAAVFVLIFHLVPLRDGPYQFPKLDWWISASPLAVFHSGHESVVFFFVLSGLVLSLSFLKAGEKVAYVPFMIKRVFRIYPVYLVSIVVGAVVKWYYGVFPEFPLKELLNHVPLINLPGIWQKMSVLNGTIWSLVVEMRLSLIFPFLVFIMCRFRRFGIPLLGGILLGLLSGYSMYQLFRYHDPYPWMTSWCGTFEFISCFMLGIAIAQNREEWTARVASMSPLIKCSVAAAALCLYTSAYLISGNNLDQYGLLGHIFSRQYVTEAFTCFGAGLFILLSLGSRLASRILCHSFFQWLGRISYSLYLWHLIVQTGVKQAFGTVWGAHTVTLVSIGLSFVVATCSYHWIERIFIDLGRKVVAKWLSRKKPVAQEASFC